MKTLKFLISILTFALIFTGCNNDDDPQPKSSAKQITSYVFHAADNQALDEDVIAAIDQNGKSITATLPNGADITTLMPNIQVSPKASVSPEGAKDFTGPVTYTVIAEDGTTATYQITVSLIPNSEKRMISFRFLGIDSAGVSVDISADIDEENKAIMAAMPSGTDVTALEPSVEISPEATLDPEGPQDFTGPRNYTVTAGDGTGATYLVTVTVALTEKEILLLISDANPGNTLGWDKDNSIEDFDGVKTDSSGKVFELDARVSGLTVLPPEIGQLSNLTYLDLGSNNLTSIPAEIGQLTNLTYLELYDNSLTSIPAEIGQLSNLTKLYIDGNSLLTSIPVEIGQLSNLTKLYLDGNSLTSIPVEIGQLSKLTVLWLQNNNLTSIPREIGQLTNLERLNLRDNNLTDIPKEIGNLKSLVRLSLEGNDDLEFLHNRICDLDDSKGGNTDIDVVPDDVACVGDEIGP